MKNTTKRVASEEDVKQFLAEVHEKVDSSFNNLKIQTRSRSEDKTFNFMAEYNLKHKDICEEILKLDVSNYSYTDEDYDKNKPGQVWLFGQTFIADGNKFFEIYIKLKLVNNVICLSFHPKEFDINYPYN